MTRENYYSLKSQLYAKWLEQLGESGTSGVSKICTRRGIALIFSHQTGSYLVVADGEVMADVTLVETPSGWKTLICTLSGDNQELEFAAPSRAAANEEIFWQSQEIYEKILSHHGYAGNSYLYRINECESDDEFSEYISFCGDDDEYEAARADEVEEERAWA